MIKLYIENLSNEEISMKIKDFCSRAIIAMRKETRTSQEVFDIILEVDDWIKAFTKLYKQYGSKDLMKVIDHLELMKACSENIAKDDHKGAQDMARGRLEEMEMLSLVLIDMIDAPHEQPSQAQHFENGTNSSGNIAEGIHGLEDVCPIPKYADQRKTTTGAVQKVLESEGIDDLRIRHVEE